MKVIAADPSNSTDLYQIWVGEEEGSVFVVLLQQTHSLILQKQAFTISVFSPKLALSSEAHTGAGVTMTGYFLARLNILQSRHKSFLEFNSVDLVPLEFVSTKTIQGKPNKLKFNFLKSYQPDVVKTRISQNRAPLKTGHEVPESWLARCCQSQTAAAPSLEKDSSSSCPALHVSFQSRKYDNPQKKQNSQ